MIFKSFSIGVRATPDEYIDSERKLITTLSIGIKAIDNNVTFVNGGVLIRSFSGIVVDNEGDDERITRQK